MLSSLTFGFAGTALVAPMGAFQDGCVVKSSSRWATPAEEGWLETAQFGVDPQHWLDGVSGIAYDPEVGVGVYEGRQGQIWILDDDLTPVRSFGQIGEGPGELEEVLGVFGRWPYPFRDLLAILDGRIYVSDQRGLHVFASDGEFVETIVRIEGSGMGMAMGFGLRFLSPSAHEILLGHSIAEFGNWSAETFRTDRVDPSGQVSAMDSLVIRWPPNPAGQGIVNEARPIWAARGRCVVFGDGHSPWLLRLDLNTGQADTLHLPDRDIRFEGRDFPEEARGLIAGRLGTSTAASAMQKWSAVGIDPDGHIWLLGRREHGEDGPEFFRIGSDGEIVPESLAVFPRAFGPPGVIYSAQYDRMVGMIVSRYAHGPL
ncbi:MAG: hypothetical protein EA351_15045 [Gemmatimonadales bacterium]|nr:MAG: hypothetical protein EA351_15045 [Gemmatimonadales bacterium]